MRQKSNEELLQIEVKVNRRLKELEILYNSLINKRSASQRIQKLRRQDKIDKLLPRKY